MEKAVQVTDILTSFVQDLVKFIQKIGEFFDTFLGDDATKPLTEDEE